MHKLASPRPAGEALEAVAALRAALEAEPEVCAAWIFGSAARGRPFHDLDVGVRLAPGALPGAGLGALAARLEAAAGVPVDLVDLDGCELALRAEVVRKGRLLADRQPAERARWELETTRRWLDFRPFAERFAELRRKALIEGRPSWSSGK